MASSPSATSFAILGLLGLQPWTAYDLVAQARRSLHFFWPRSEAHLYAELKRLVERGHAHAEVVEGRRRQPPLHHHSARPCRAGAVAHNRAGPTHGRNRDTAACPVRRPRQPRGLTRNAGDHRNQTREQRVAAVSIGDELLTTGGPFPQRLHLVERLGALYGEFLLLLERWCEETLTEIETWPDTRDVGLTPQSRKRLEHLVDRARRSQP